MGKYELCLFLFFLRRFLCVMALAVLDGCAGTYSVDQGGLFTLGSGIKGVHHYHLA